MPDPEPWKPSKPSTKAPPRVGDQVKGGVLGPKADAALKRAKAAQQPVLQGQKKVVPKVSPLSKLIPGLVLLDVLQNLDEDLGNEIEQRRQERIRRNALQESKDRKTEEAVETGKNKKKRSGRCPKTTNRASDGSKCGGRAASVRGKTAGYEGFSGIKDGKVVPGPVTKPTAPQKADRSTWPYRKK